MRHNDTTNAMYQIGPITERPVFTSVFQIETKDGSASCVLRDEPVQTFHPRATLSAASYQCKKRIQRRMADSDGGVFINNGCNGWSKKEGVKFTLVGRAYDEGVF